MLKNKLCVPVHFVWATWDRLPLIGTDIEHDLYRYMKKVCCDDKCEVLAVGGMPNHIHLLVMLPNTITLGDLMKHVKGGSSRFFSQKLRPGEWFAWQGSYAANAICHSKIGTVVKYIANQKHHHAGNTIWPGAEETGDEA